MCANKAHIVHVMKEFRNWKEASGKSQLNHVYSVAQHLENMQAILLTSKVPLDIYIFLVFTLKQKQESAPKLQENYTKEESLS